MKSSAITLLHKDKPFRDVKKRLKAKAKERAAAAAASGSSSEEQATITSTLPAKVPYLVNLIDSPGHVDFSADVSTAVRMCDGALVVVDVGEGVCSQTHAVLRAAWAERVRLVLVLNKVDRLVTELGMSPEDAYDHLSHIIQEVNVICSNHFRAELLQDDEDDDDSDDSGRK